MTLSCYFCNVPPVKKKKKGQTFVVHIYSHLTPLTPNLHHSFHTNIFSLAGSSTSSLFFLFFSFSHTVLSTLILSTGASTPPPPPFSTTILRQDHRKIYVNP